MAATGGWPASVVHVLPDKLGGVATIVSNLLEHRRPDGLAYHAVLTHNRLGRDTRYGHRMRADGQVTVEYTLPTENLHAVLQRLARAIPPGPGALVCSDWIELAMCCVRDPGRAVVHLLHGDHAYYYDLAQRHEAVVDTFVVYGRVMYEKLCALLPHRREAIHHLPYGIVIPERARTAGTGALRLVFAGRLDNSQKGVFDLPRIDAALTTAGLALSWTIVGDGPDRAELRRRWPESPRVGWLGARTNAEVRALLPEHDVFVLPSRAEGVPVALLEAMAAGVVPVVSDIPSGIGEAVEDGRTGILRPVGDTAGFADAIGGLDRDRARLEAMGLEARRCVASRHDIRDRMSGYQALYARWGELRRPRPPRVPLAYGSRLDRPWLPNTAVYATRLARRLLGGRRP
jgi:glycosyltransferase involved in cell wall biosynthesis